MNKSAYFPYFDYLRIILASVVMLAHDEMIEWPYAGKLAVDVFFALSGWLIAGILLKLKPNNLPRFYFNRAIRIWVPYFIALVFVIGASLLKDPINAKWLEFTLYKSSFVYNIFGPPQLEHFRETMPLDGTANHFWTVNAEEQFYLVCPLLLVLLPKFGKTISFWVVAAAVAWYFQIYPAIFFGVLAAIVNSKFPNFYEGKWQKSVFAAVVVGGGVAMYYGDLLVSPPLFSIALVLLIAIKGVPNPIGKFLGGISYPLYLNHWIGVFLLNAILSPLGLAESPLRHGLSVLANFAIAAVLYIFVDRVILAKRSGLYTEKLGKSVTFAAYAITALGILYGIWMTRF